MDKIPARWHGPGDPNWCPATDDEHGRCVKPVGHEGSHASVMLVDGQPALVGWTAPAN